MGFCVASTRNGCSSGIAGVADGDLLFLHRFQQGALHLGRARLISSARTRLAKIGPFLMVNSPVRGL